MPSGTSDGANPKSAWRLMMVLGRPRSFLAISETQTALEQQPCLCLFRAGPLGAEESPLWRSVAAGPFFGVSGRMNWLPGPPLHQPFVL